MRIPVACAHAHSRGMDKSKGAHRKMMEFGTAANNEDSA
jgi:hypothetical protein